MFDINPAKKSLRRSIEAASLWAEIASRVGRHKRTVKRWFDSSDISMPVELVLVCSEYPELKPVLSQAVDSFSRHLSQSNNQVWYLSYRYQFYDNSDSPKQTMFLLGQLCEVLDQMAGMDYILKESSSSRLALLDLQTPYKPKTIPTDQDVFGIRYLAPEDFTDAESGLDYNQLSASIYEELFGRPMADWVKELSQHCERSAVIRSVLKRLGK